MIGFLKHLVDYQIFLASRSPRRNQLLVELGIPFDVWLKEEVEENFSPELTKENVAIHLAEIKARPYQADLKSDHILITADTIVCRDEHILGKPNDYEEAYAMIKSLSGREHSVITGVCLSNATTNVVFAVDTKVHFSEIDHEEIKYYLNSFKPYDKAGSYGIQEWIGLIAVESINGSYFNVMGLPIQRLYQELKRFTNYNTSSN